MILDDEVTETIRNTWITADEAIERHGIDPVGKPSVRNKLERRDRHFVRVYLEADVIALKGKP